MVDMTKHELRINSAMSEFKTLMATDYGASQEYAYQKSGCLVAYPTWWLQKNGGSRKVGCVHMECMIRRGEYGNLPAWNVRLNAQFRGELTNWLRFAKETIQGRRAIARLYWEMKKRKEFDIMSCVWAGVLA